MLTVPWSSPTCASASRGSLWTDAATARTVETEIAYHARRYVTAIADLRGAVGTNRALAVLAADSAYHDLLLAVEGLCFLCDADSCPGLLDAEVEVLARRSSFDPLLPGCPICEGGTGHPCNAHFS